MKRKRTHDIHASQLRPNLHEDSNDGTVEHARLKEIQVSDIPVESFKLAHILDILEFKRHEWAVGIPLSVDESQNRMAFFPTIFACQPTRRFGKEHHCEEKAYRWDHLDAPRYTEGCCAVVVGVLTSDE
jgi:hypothetical protein